MQQISYEELLLRLSIAGGNFSSSNLQVNFIGDCTVSAIFVPNEEAMKQGVIAYTYGFKNPHYPYISVITHDEGNFIIPARVLTHIHTWCKANGHNYKWMRSHVPSPNPNP